MIPMEVSASTVKELREKTGAGVMDCKKALAECGGDLEKAVDYLRRKGLAAAVKKGSRVAAEGLVGAYIHPGGKIGVMVEINCETDFVARTAEFQGLLKDVAMQVAAANPRYVRREEISGEELERERSIYQRQALDSGKPEKVVEKIVARQFTHRVRDVQGEVVRKHRRLGEGAHPGACRVEIASTNG